MRFEIFGAGIAGAYFANLIDGVESYNLYEKRKKPDCRCAWGWANYSKVRELVKRVGLNSEDYVLSMPRYAIVNGVEMKIRDVVTFDKPKFIEDLRENVEVKYEVPKLCDVMSDKTILVDATGNSRAIMKNFDRYEPVKLKTVQIKTKTDELFEDTIYIFAKRYGYAWAFPIGDEWHIGAGGFTKEQAAYLYGSLFKKYGVKIEKTECGCGRDIMWDLSVTCCRYIYEYPKELGAVAIGEAGGFVSGFGEGNTLAMETALCLAEAYASADDVLDVVHKYSKGVKEETSWIVPQYDFIKTLNKNWFLALFKVRKVIKTANMRNMDASIWDGLRLMWSLR